MNTHLFHTLVSGVLCVASVSSFSLAQGVTDSLRDMFPLAIGNEWVYHHSEHFQYDPSLRPTYDWKDSGTVELRVIANTTAPDSTFWKLSSRYTSAYSYNLGPWSEPQIHEDTLTIAECLSGNHQLSVSCETRDPKYFVLPFLANLADSARVFRFAVVDSTNRFTVAGLDSPWSVRVILAFAEDSGLVESKQGSLITGWPSFYIHSVLIRSVITGISAYERNEIPQTHTLETNFPNPFNASTTIWVQSPGAGYAELTIYDALGRRVCDLFTGTLARGVHTFRWTADQVPSGTYFYRLVADGSSQTKPMILIK